MLTREVIRAVKSGCGGRSQTNYDVLRPDVWKQSHPEAIRIYRVEERQARADAKAVKRARRRISRG